MYGQFSCDLGFDFKEKKYAFVMEKVFIDCSSFLWFLFSDVDV